MNEVLKTIAAKYKDDIVHTASELIQRNSQSLHEHLTCFSYIHNGLI